MADHQNSLIIFMLVFIVIILDNSGKLGKLITLWRGTVPTANPGGNPPGYAPVNPNPPTK
jgi:hypothetical protein